MHNCRYAINAISPFLNLSVKGTGETKNYATVIISLLCFNGSQSVILASSIPWELVRNANSQASSIPTASEPLWVGPSNLCCPRWLYVLSGLRTTALFHDRPSLQHSSGGNLSSQVTWQDHKVIHWRHHSNKDLRQNNALTGNNNYQWNTDFCHYTTGNMGLFLHLWALSMAFKDFLIRQFLCSCFFSLPDTTPDDKYFIYLLFTHGEEK